MSNKNKKATAIDHQVIQDIEVIDASDPDQAIQPPAPEHAVDPPPSDPDGQETTEATPLDVIEVAGSAPESIDDEPAMESGTDEPAHEPDAPAEVEILGRDEDSQAPLETSDDEMDDTAADVIDSELLQLLRTPLGLRGAVEALLFSSPEPLTARRIARAVGVGDIRLVTATLQQLQTDYDNQRRGLQIVESTQGFQMATREMFGDLILNLRGRKRRPSLSQAALETLAIVAYRQPIIRAEVEAIRGVESSGTIRNLIDMGLVEMVGRKDVIGRPPMYGTTETFLNTFGLKQIEDLPSIGDLKRHADEEEKKNEAAEVAQARTDREKAEKDASDAAEAARIAREQAALALAAAQVQTGESLGPENPEDPDRDEDAPVDDETVEVEVVLIEDDEEPHDLDGEGGEDMGMPGTDKEDLMDENEINEDGAFIEIEDNEESDNEGDSPDDDDEGMEVLDPDDDIDDEDGEDDFDEDEVGDEDDFDDVDGVDDEDDDEDEDDFDDEDEFDDEDDEGEDEDEDEDDDDDEDPEDESRS